MKRTNERQKKEWKELYERTKGVLSAIREKTTRRVATIS